jgi:hypothetical protein
MIILLLIVAIAAVIFCAGMLAYLKLFTFINEEER